ncbi:MAG: CoA transferase, partial [Acidimicrobiales bacterium]|nr:CoA transferase [Acidimicrobiales bacterium]
AAGIEPQRAGNLNPLATPFEIYEVDDGAVAICAPTDSGFAAFVELLGRPELASDERFAGVAPRLANRDALRAELESALAGRTRDAVVELLQRGGVPAGSVRSVPEALESAQANARRMVLDVEGTRLRIPGHPLHLSSVDDDPTRTRAAGLGAHTEALRAEFGFG